MTRSMCSLSSALAVVLLASGSGAFAADAVPPGVSAAVTDAGRPAEDKDRDGDRKPAESVALAGLKKGDKVVDVFPGRGYFTRIFSKVVGDSGVVYAVPPAPRPNAPAGAPDPAAASNALAAEPAHKNVKVVKGTYPELTLPEPVDLVWTSLNYHDIHNMPNDGVAAFNKSVFAALKPGGTYIVIDHAAEAGSGARDTTTLHRIDPEIVKKEVTAAGFEFATQGDFLKHPQDAHTARVHDATIKGKTDQFILKFTKPKK